MSVKNQNQNQNQSRDPATKDVVAHSAKSPFSEQDYMSLFDRCCADAAIKVGSGFVIGGLCSLLFLGRRTFPIWLGTGYGMGAAYMACQNNLKAVTQTISFNEKEL